LDFFLGKFPGDLDVQAPNDVFGSSSIMTPATTRHYFPSPGSWKTYYLSQNFSSGTHCDLINGPRQTEIRIRCDPNAYGIFSVEEIESCKYVVVIISHVLCETHGFQLEENEISQITCHTVNPKGQAVRGLDLPTSMPEQLGPLRFQKTLSSPVTPFDASVPILPLFSYRSRNFFFFFSSVFENFRSLPKSLPLLLLQNQQPLLLEERRKPTSPLHPRWTQMRQRL